MTSDYVRCVNCGFDNSPEAIRCAQCDMSLRGVTTIAAPALASLEDLEKLAKPQALSINEVLFLIAGQQDPIVVTMEANSREILIGRGVGSENPPDLDLVAFSEAAHSISRRHARLDFSGAEATITDLGSTNGSWLNENRLTPHNSRVLHNGDLVRVGQQFMFVYFATTVDAVQIITLTDARTTATPFTPRLLARLSSFLELLSPIQELCSAVRQQPTKPITIKAFNLNHAPQTTKVRIAEASDALQLITEVVNRWRDQVRDMLPHAEDTDPLWDDLAQQVQAYLVELAPDLTTPEHAMFTEELLPHLRAVVQHELELTLATSWD